MPKGKENNKKEDLVTSYKSVHVIYLSCAHCEHEMDYIHFCPECGQPMRVIDVVEKFGDDAERFLQRAKNRVVTEVGSEDVEIDKEEPNIILMGEENFDDDDGIDPNGQEHKSGLDVIFPSDDEDLDEITSSDVDDDLTKALEMLDEEDENVTAQDFGFEDGEIPEL